MRARGNLIIRAMSDGRKQVLVFALPALFSLLMSALTVGTTVFWQDSGFYLNAVHEMSVLYPHGFALYQVLCK